MQRIANALGTPDPDDSRQAFEIMTVEEVAQYLRLPASSVYKMTCPSAELQLPHLKVGGRLRFIKADIDDFLKKMKRWG